MSTISISLKEYEKLLQIKSCAEVYLDTKLEATENRLSGYINDHNSMSDES